MLRKEWMVTLGLGLAGASMLVAHAAQDTAHLNIKLGLWEMAMNPKVSGDVPSIPEDRLQNMPPEQRAKVQASMQAMMADMNKPKLMKECMTPEKLAKGFNTANADSANCKTTVLKNTSSEIETTQQCSDAQGSHTSRLHVSALSTDHVQGSAHSEMSRGAKNMVFDATVEGKWLGPDCGTVKDAEMEHDSK
jgi:hypothetical protein